MTKRLIVLLSSIFLGLLVTLSLPHTVRAATPKLYDNNVMQKLLTEYCSRRSTGEINLETWYGGKCNPQHIEESIGFGDIIILHLAEKVTGGQQGKATDIIKDNVNKLFKCFGSGDPFKCVVSLENQIKQQPSLASINQQGLLPALAGAMNYMFTNPPATSVEYLANVKTNLASHNIIKPTYAASSATGYGFQALSALLPIWRIFRDISYLIFVLIFLYYGFMIMFRMKMVGAQTAVSLEMALPKLVVTLLLITFSYAIAGFLIDLFYLLIGFFFSLFAAAGLISNLGLAKTLSGFQYGLMVPFIWSLVQSILLSGKIFFAIIPVTGVLATVINFILAPLSMIIGLILLIAVAVTFAKLVWMLLQAYVNMILQIIFAPLLLLGNAFPGSKSFGNWIKAIFAELMVFASVIFLFTLAFYFLGGIQILSANIGSIGTLDKSTGLWAPPPLYPQWLSEALDPDIAATSNESKFALVGMGIILMTPKLADAIRKALQVADSGFIGQEIGSNLNAGLGFANNHPVNLPFGRKFNSVANAGRNAINKAKGII